MEGQKRNIADKLDRLVSNSQFKELCWRDPQPFIAIAQAALFPQYRLSRTSNQSTEEILLDLSRTLGELFKDLKVLESEKLGIDFINNLPDLYSALVLDAEAMFAGDPAAKSVDEVIITYPGFFATVVYRISHFFYEKGETLLARLLTEFSHSRTGIDIHPGANIGRSLCIDHGTGIVIGESSVIGDQVKIYQGVTLGALSVEKQAAGKKRHPTVEDRVVLYSNATVLGGSTVIGHDSIIGGNVWLTESVPPNSTVYHKGDIIKRTFEGEKA